MNVLVEVQGATAVRKFTLQMSIGHSKNKLSCLHPKVNHPGAEKGGTEWVEFVVLFIGLNDNILGLKTHSGTGESVELKLNV